MSIVKNGKSYTATCDICGEELPAEFDFYDAVNSKKENGWKSQKYQGEWQDVCPACQGGGQNE